MTAPAPTVPLPRSASELTAEWLTAALGDAAAAPVTREPAGPELSPITSRKD